MAEGFPRSQHRTAEEAVAQANAEARLRNAQNVRIIGIGVLVAGVAILIRRRTWLPSNQLINVQLHSGAWFTLSLAAVMGVLAIMLGPVLIVVGQRLLKRAINAAANDPATAEIVRRPSRWAP